MGEGGGGIESGEAREGPSLVRIVQVHRPGKKGKAGSGNSFQYLRDSLEKNDDPKGGLGVVGGYSRFVEHNAILFL